MGKPTGFKDYMFKVGANTTVTLQQDSAATYPVGASIDFYANGTGAAFAAGTGATYRDSVNWSVSHDYSGNPDAQYWLSVHAAFCAGRRHRAKLQCNALLMSGKYYRALPACHHVCDTPMCASPPPRQPATI